ncbi:MAG: DUF503 domain-containing protein [Candidatus Sumerlaeaceae bacterium]
MVIALFRVRLHIPFSHSLKEKRSVLKRTIHHLRTSYNCAVSEIDDQDLWQSAVLAIVTVYANRAQVDSLFRAVERDLSTSGDFELVGQQIEIL